MNYKGLFGISAPPARGKLRADVKEDVLAELDELLAFVKAAEGAHVELDHVVEHILEDYLNSQKKEVRVFREWKELQANQTGDAAGEVDAKPADNEPKTEPVAKPSVVQEKPLDGRGDIQTDSPVAIAGAGDMAGRGRVLKR